MATHKKRPGTAWVRGNFANPGMADRYNPVRVADYPRKHLPASQRPWTIQRDSDADAKLLQRFIDNPHGCIAECERKGIHPAALLEKMANMEASAIELNAIAKMQLELGNVDDRGRPIMPKEIKPRRCLRCERWFMSKSYGNRTCQTCANLERGVDFMTEPP